MNLPTLKWHFFEKSQLTITDATFNTIIITNYECLDNFVLDEKSFDMLKKLGGPIVVKNNTITFNKYKCQNQKVVKPELNLDNIIYSNIYNASDLKESIRFVGGNTNLSLQGVLFNDNGDIFATDSFKFYFKRNIGKSTRYWSVPTQFIKLLPDGEVKLSFTDTMVMYECDDYKLYSRLYNSKVPAIEKICDVFKTNYEITFEIKPELTYLPCQFVNIKAENDLITFLFDDNEKQFEVDYKNDLKANFDVKIAYDHFTQVLAISQDQLKIEFGNKLLRVNDKVIICCVN